MRNLLFTLLGLVALAAGAQNPVTPPYTQEFSSATSLDDFIILDLNGDEASWEYNGYIKCARCSNYSNADMDDWLILPVNLEAGASYELTFHAYGSTLPERVEVCVGQTPTAAGLTQKVMERKEVTLANEKDVQRATIRVEETGVWYIGIHGCSERDHYTLFVDDITLEKTVATAPAASTNVVAVPGAKGANQCDLTFTLPTTTVDGTPLSYIECVRVYRNDILVRTIYKDTEGNDVTPGATCHWLNKELSNRLYTYQIVAVGEKQEEGAPATVEVYVGIDSPGPITNLTCREDLSRPGTVVVEWDAPTEGIHGGYVDMKQVHYVVCNNANNDVVVSGTRYEEQIDISRGQTVAVYSVYAENQVGSSRLQKKTLSTHVGPAMSTPWMESFTSGTVKGGAWLTHVTGNTQIGEASWYTASIFAGYPDQDGDGGYTHFFTSGLGKSARFTSPKINISTLASPTLSFWIYMTGKEDFMEVQVRPDMTEWQTLGSFTLAAEKGWKRFTYDLSAFKSSQCIEFGINGHSVVTTENITFVDNFSINTSTEKDVVITKHNFPTRVDMGKKANFTVTLRNMGSAALAEGDYTVQLFRTDCNRVVDTKAGVALNVDQVKSMTLTDTPDVYIPDNTSYRIDVLLDGDSNTANNTTGNIATHVLKPNYPSPTRLMAVSEDEGLALSWQQPDLSEGISLPFTESFERFPAFQITPFGEWTMHDGDEQYTLTMAITAGSSVTALQYPHAGEQMAWQVFNSDEAGIPYSSWEPHYGNQMMVAMGNAKAADGTYHENDDWLITPRLSGRAQTISFFAKCGMGAAYQPEVLELLYSTTTNNVDAFQPLPIDLIELYNVNAWEEYLVKIPEGARYVAFRCASYNKFALLLDDVMYQPDGDADLELVGYYVYRDRMRLTTTPLTTTSFMDTTAEKNHTYEYAVTALYTDGESTFSESRMILNSIEGISHLNDNLDPHNAGRTYDLQGRAIYNAPKGIYIKNGRKLMK